MTEAVEFAKLAHEAALRSLDKQERVLEELRARTGVLLGASSLAAAFLGQEAFGAPAPTWLIILALGAFVVAILSSLFVLLPKDNLVFAESGTRLYEGLFEVRDDLAEVHRQLTYGLSRYWVTNNMTLIRLVRVYRYAALALVVEIICLSAILTGSII